MSATYSLFLADPYGVRLSDALPFTKLSYTRVVGGISAAVVELPDAPAMARLPDGRLEIWRRLPNGREYLDTDISWLLKTRQRQRNDKGLLTTTLIAASPLCLLREPGRMVSAYAGSAAALKTGAADDVMKAIVREQAGTLASDAARNLAPYLTVAPNISQGPTVSRAFAWRAVLDVLKDLADDAAQQGYYLTYDIISPDSQGYEFRTYTQQRGVDRRSGTNSPVIVSPEFGTLGESQLVEDWTDEITYALIGGAGEGTARVLGEYVDTTRVGASPFGRRETFRDYTQTADPTVLTGLARGVVRGGRARTLFTGKILDTPDCHYGVHWSWGDYITAQDFGQSFDCRIDAITVDVGPGSSYETITAALRAEL